MLCSSLSSLGFRVSGSSTARRNVRTVLFKYAYYLSNGADILQKENRRKMADAGGGKAVDTEEGGAKSKDTGGDGGQDCPRYNLPFLNLTADSPTNTPVETEIVGKIPTWLEGSLYRNGPGIFRVGDVHLKHLFDGFAILHRFDIHGGKVTYTSRVLDTDTYERSIKTKRLVTTQFGTFLSPDPCKSIFGKVMSFFKPRVSDPTDNVSVNIVEHGDRLYALTETPWLVRVHPHTLLKEDRENLTRTIAVHMSTAHPHFDKEGNMYNLATAFNPPNNYNIVKIPPASTPDAEVVQGAQLLVSLQSRWSFSIGYNHSFGMSREHYVILEQPITMGSMKFLTNNWRKAAIYDCFSKHPNEELVFRVVRRQDNQEVKVKFRAEAAFTFHFINCFEDQGHLVVDFTGYSDLSVIDQLYLKNLDKGGLVPAKPMFRRYVIPLTLEQKGEGVNLVTLPNTSATAIQRRDGTVFLSPDYITEGVMMELPRINYGKVSGEKYRYVYGTRFFSENPQLVKLDVEKKAVMTWTPDEGYQPGEPVFVPKPEGTMEDDGVILSPVVGLREDQRCYLVALDAATFQELGRAYAPKGVQMSISFHGSYVQPKADKK